MSIKDKNNFEDDGRTIADMSGIDGYSGSALMRGLFSKKKEKQSGEPQNEVSNPQEQMPRQERRAYVLAAIGAVLLIGSIFLVGIGLIIWLMTLLLP